MSANDKNRERAEQSFKVPPPEKEKGGLAEDEERRLAEREKTKRLRAQRLAKEAADTERSRYRAAACTGAHARAEKSTSLATDLTAGLQERAQKAS
jgi:hypothetical protein